MLLAAFAMPAHGVRSKSSSTVRFRVLNYFCLTAWSLGVCPLPQNAPVLQNSSAGVLLCVRSYSVLVTELRW